MSYLKLIPLIGMLLAGHFSVQAAEKPLLLENFDLEAIGDFERLEQTDIADFEKDGDLEARFTASGRKAVFRLKFKRSSEMIQRIISGEKPVFQFDVGRPEGFTPITPTKLQLVVQTNVVVKEDKHFYGRVVIKSKMSEVGAGIQKISLNLSKAVLSEGELFADLLAKYEAGEGTYFMLVVLQVAKEDEVGSAIYDNFEMAAVE